MQKLGRYWCDYFAGKGTRETPAGQRGCVTAGFQTSRESKTIRSLMTQLSLSCPLNVMWYVATVHPKYQKKNITLLLSILKDSFRCDFMMGTCLWTSNSQKFACGKIQTASALSKNNDTDAQNNAVCWWVFLAGKKLPTKFLGPRPVDYSWYPCVLGELFL